MCSQVLHGWRFWSVEGSEKPKSEPKAKADKPKKAKNESAAKNAKKSGKAKKKGKAVRAAASDASYGCGVCPETFPTMKDATEHAMTHTS